MKVHGHLDASAAGRVHARQCVSLCLDRCCNDMIRPQAAAALGEVAIVIVVLVCGEARMERVREADGIEIMFFLPLSFACVCFLYILSTKILILLVK